MPATQLDRPTPPPPGPTPPAGTVYGYLVVPPIPPVIPPSSLYLPFNIYHDIEFEIGMRGLTVHRLDRFNRYRVYRSRIEDIWRFDSDAYGAFIGRPPKLQFRWVYTDPTAAMLALNEWTPLGP